jgi:hypothetical protein
VHQTLWWWLAVLISHVMGFIVYCQGPGKLKSPFQSDGVEDICDVQQNLILSLELLFLLAR